MNKLQEKTLSQLQGDVLGFEKAPENSGVLGYLKGVIADLKNPTRNGNFYGEDVWNYQFKQPVVQEMLKNKVLFGELDHPAERSETLLSQAAICLTEPPTKQGDYLVGKFAILDTPNGKITANLAKFGSSLGISSRGDYDDPEGPSYDGKVDPKQYHLKGFDVVLLPAVKAARMKAEGLKAVNESYQESPLKRALCESYKTLKTKEQKETFTAKLFTINKYLKEDISEADFQDLDATEYNPDETGADTMEPAGTADMDLGEMPGEVSDVQTDDLSQDAGLDPMADPMGEPMLSGRFAELGESLDKLGVVYTESQDEKNPTLEVDLLDQKEKLSAIINTIKADYEFIINTDSNGVLQSVTIKDKLPDETAVEDGELTESLAKSLNEKIQLKDKVTSLQKDVAAGKSRETELSKEVSKLKESIASLAKKAQIADSFKNNFETQKKLVEQLQEQMKAKDAEVKKLNEALKATPKLQEAKTITESVKTINLTDEQRKTLNESFNKELADRDARVEEIRKSNLQLQEQLKNAKSKASRVLEQYVSEKAKAYGIDKKLVISRLPKIVTFEEINRVVESLSGISLVNNKINIVEGIKGQRIAAKPVEQLFDDEDYLDTL